MKKAVSCILPFVLPLVLTAAPVTVEQAKKATANWVRGRRSLDRKLGRNVVSAETYAATNGAPFHVVKLDAGFVVTTGDTTLDPVIVHSSGDDLTPDERNPLWVLVRKDVALRAQAAGLVAATGLVKKVSTAAAGTSAGLSAAERAWADLLADDDGAQNTATNGLSVRTLRSVASVADVRVEPLVQSTWDQMGVGSKYVYNYYTPNHVYCGCVATAGAQIMRYFEWPKTAMSTFTCSHCSYQGTTQTYTTQGGTYDWSNMPLKPTSSIMETQQKAIGKLTSDLGICTGMKYTSSGSGTGGYMLRFAFTEHFGYSNAMIMQRTSCTDEETKRAFISNFEAGLPVAVFVGESGKDGGHAIVGDGYGYSGGTLCYHLNLGWGGSCDAWYAPPDLAAGGYDFNVIDGFVYNIYTNGSANAVICSGRILDSSGNPIAGATVEAVKNGVAQKRLTTNEKGSYAFILSAGSYTVKATYGAVSGTLSVKLSACTSLRIITDNSSDYFGYYYESPTPTVGNVCDQDITLSVATYEVLEHPAFVPYTQVTRSADGTTSGKVASRFEDGEGNVVYSLLTEHGRAYALGLDGYPEGAWVTGDGTPQLLKAKKLSSGEYSVLVKAAE